MNQDTAYFQDALARHVEVYRDHFGERLRAVYVWGSVYRAEVVRGLSDLDLHAFIGDSYTDLDATWYGQARSRLDAEYPGLNGLTRPFAQRVLLDGAKPDADDGARAMTRALSFRLHYDALLVWGGDLVPRSSVPVPNGEFARGPFEAVRDLARFGAGADTENKTDFALPEAPMLRLRKLARLAVLGGGYLLMARGKFRSFKGTDVLPALHSALPAWQDFLEETERHYIAPQADAPAVLPVYQDRLVEWVAFVEPLLNTP